MDKTQIVQHLRRGNPTRRSRCIDPRLADTGKIKGRYIRPFGIGLALSKEETEAAVTCREFVDDAWRDDPAIANREIRRASKHFAVRWITGKDLWPAIQRITFKRVVIGPKVAHEHTVVRVEIMIDAGGDSRAPDCRWRIPQKGSSIQAITGTEIIRQRKRIDQRPYGGVKSPAADVIQVSCHRTNVICSNTANTSRGRGAKGNKQRSGARIHQQRTVTRDSSAIDDQRIGRIRHEVAEDSITRLLCVNNWYPERLINRLREVDAIILIAAKKEGLVLPDRTSHFKARLEHSDQRLRRVLRIGKKLIRVQCFIAKK